MKRKPTYFLMLVFVCTSLFSFGQWSTVSVFLEQGTLDKAKVALNKGWEKVKAKETAGKLKKPGKAWSEANFYKGQVYGKIANDLTGIYSKNDPDALFIAYDAYQKAIDLDKDGKGKGEAAKTAIKALWRPAYNYAVKKFQATSNLEGDAKIAGYKESFKGFNMVRMLKPEDTLGNVYTNELAYLSKEYKVYEETMGKTFLLTKPKQKTFKYLRHAIYLRDKKKDNNQALKVTNEGLMKCDAKLDAKNYAVLEELQLELLNKLGKSSEAITLYENAIQKNPNEIKNYLRLGMIYQNEGVKSIQKGEKEKTNKNYENAEKAFNKALQLEPNNYIALKNMMVVHFNKGVNIQKVIANWDVTTYNKKGKGAQILIKEHYKKALPYLEKVKAHEDFNNDNMKQQIEDIHDVIKDTLK